MMIKAWTFIVVAIVVALFTFVPSEPRAPLERIPMAQAVDLVDNFPVDQLATLRVYHRRCATLPFNVIEQVDELWNRLSRDAQDRAFDDIYRDGIGSTWCAVMRRHFIERVIR